MINTALASDLRQRAPDYAKQILSDAERDPV